MLASKCTGYRHCIAIDVKLLPYEDTLEQLNLWSLEDRCTIADLIEVFKIIHGLSSIKFSIFSNILHMVVQGAIS